jgi:tetratricopeptide (TPR) repeat protein
MARKRSGRGIGKWLAALVLAAIAYLGLHYGAWLNDMDRAAAVYAKGDVDGALRIYESIEHRIRAFHALRIIPARDRRNLFLNQARLLYTLKKYGEAAETLRKEDQISGETSDSRFFLLRGSIAFRRAMLQYRQSAPKVYTLYTPTTDLRLFEENLLGSEDSFREALRLDPNDWDAKYNLEFVNSMRKSPAPPDPEKLRRLGEAPQITQLPPESAG